MHTHTKRYFGLAIIVIGIIILINSLHLHPFVSRFLLPAALAFIGLHFYRKNQRLLAGLFFGIALLLFFSINIFGLLIALLFIYFGYRLLQKKDVENGRQNEQEQLFQSFAEENEKKSFIGEVRYTQRFELKDQMIQLAIGDVKIDLTKAAIQNGETIILINSWVGSVDIYVPYDLEVAVDASVNFGELEIFERKESGVNRRIITKTAHYDEAVKKVKIILSLFVGDIDVRYL